MDEKKRVSCPRCGATNNHPLATAGKTVVCGKCKTPLPYPGLVLEPDAVEVETLIRSASLPVLIDFYSPTCMPCRQMHPVLEGLAKRRAGDLMVVRVETDRNRELAAAFGIRAVPTFVVMKKGTELGRVSGAMPEADLALWVASRS
jgi:thioredoxin 2